MDNEKNINYKALLDSKEEENKILRIKLKEANKREASKYKRIKELEATIEKFFSSKAPID